MELCMACEVSFQRDDILRVIRAVDLIVVSLDRIGAATAEMSEVDRGRVLNDFSPRVFKELSFARRILCDAFSTELGSDAMDELERHLQDQEYWTLIR
jgi:hypothetical protein